MALVFCWECGEKVSDSAATCPHCGAPLKKSDNESGPVEYQQRIERVRCWGTSSAAIQNALSKYTVDGWEIVSMAQDHWWGGALSPVFTVTMRKPKEKGYTKKASTPAMPQTGAKGTPPAGTCKLGPLTMKAEGAGYTVTYCDRGAGSAEIPEECGGYPVLAIANGAFKATGIRSVTIPDSVTVIGAYAFQDCRSLQKVIIGRGVKKIRFSAFKGCDLLRTVYYRGTDTSWGDVTIEDGNRELLSNQILLCE